jgi:hypothetical protein
MFKKITFLLSLGCFLTIAPQSVQASHSWGSYHWARTSNPFTLNLGNNVSSSWSAYLSTTSSDWNSSTILKTRIVPGMTTPRNCRATNGRIEVCNNKYGKTGWLGIAQIWTSGNHITQGVTKLNDTYFNTSQYNTPAWKNLVMCQEVGHTFGLNHQDETFDNFNLGSCMDYTNDPSGLIKSQPNNEHPNAHDYDQLSLMYAHLDTSTTIQSGVERLPLGQSISTGILNELENRKGWGTLIRDNGHTALFEKNLGHGMKVFTFTIWAQ